MLTRLLLFACASITLLLASCRKEVPNGTFKNGRIALTFDDAYVDSWYQQIDLLDSLRIKATFYISTYHNLTASQKEKLKEIESRGHEIAYHTTHHYDLVEEVKKHGMAYTEVNEINADLALMEADGYTVTNFAYPYGSHSSQLNTCLLRRFKSVRALSNRQNYNKSLVKEVGDWKVLYAADVDNNALKEKDIWSLMDKARDHNDCLMLVAHRIEDYYEKLQISRERLIAISKEAADRNLEFVTVNSIAK